jgi:hypothetical protein
MFKVYFITGPLRACYNPAKKTWEMKYEFSSKAAGMQTSCHLHNYAATKVDVLNFLHFTGPRNIPYYPILSNLHK